MKSDIFKLDGTIELNEKALDRVEALANYHEFDARDVLIVRLLAEEGIKAVSNILKLNNGELWVETNDKDFDIHIKVKTIIYNKQKQDIIEISKGKVNTPKKGILGKISMMMDSIIYVEGLNDVVFNMDNMGNMSNIGSIGKNGQYEYYWAMSKAAELDSESEEENDELAGIEQTIIEKFATDIIVTVLTDNAELVIKKSKN